MVNTTFGQRKALILGILDYFMIFAAVAAALLAALQKVAPADLSLAPHPVGDILIWLRAQAWWLILGLMVAGGAAKAWKERLAAAWVWSVVKAIVDRIAQDAFKDTPGPQYFHRATLFRRQQCWWPKPFKSRLWPWGNRGSLRWPWSGWLVPVVRSGGTTQKSATPFLAPDEPDQAEGIAGFTWASNLEIKKSFPVAIDSSSQAAHIVDYARETGVSEDWVRGQIRSNKVLAASFTGIPIEVQGQRWGVLVLDSREPNAASNVPINMGQHAFVLGKLLERV